MDTESNQKFYEEFLKDVPEGGTVLFVYFATRIEAEIPEKFETHVKMCKAQAHGKSFNFFIATQENFLTEIRRSDALFFNGGSTSKLLKILWTYSSIKDFIDGMTIAGSSAGAYALATLGASHSEEVVREGLGLVSVRLICHDQSPKLPPSQDSVKLLEETSNELELIKLKDCEWKIIKI